MAAPLPTSEMTTVGSGRRRAIWVGLLFVGLAAVEILHGLFHISTLRARTRSEIVEDARRRHSDIAHDLRSLFDSGRENAGFLLRSKEVRALAEHPADEANRVAAHALLLPYLVAFRGIDAVSVFSADDKECLRCERIGNGVGAIPPAELGRPLDAEWKTIAEALGPFEVAPAHFINDDHRVEMPASDRIVLHYVAPLTEADHSVGTIVVRVYASPFLSAVRRFAPCEGAGMTLLDGAGIDLLAALGPETAPRPIPEFAAAEKTSTVSRDGWTFVDVVGDSPVRRIVAYLPRAGVDDASSRIGGTYFWVVGSMVALTIILVGSGSYFFRLSMREIRLREDARHVAAIARESQKYRTLMEDAADMILIVDPADGAIREANAIARETLEITSEVINGSTPLRIDDLVSEADRTRFADATAEVTSGPTGRAAITDLTLVTRSGTRRIVGARCAAVTIDDGKRLQWLMRDLTRQRDVERQLRIAERLGSLGQLTAGVAHEINNPLEGIGNYLSLIGRDGLEPEKRKRYLELIHHGFQRIRDIVRDLGAFARPAIATGHADLAQVVANAARLTAYGKDMRGVTIDVVGLAEPLRVPGDGGRLEQVFLNLFLNAAQAMGGHGRIVVTALRDLPESEFVEITVDDEGPGIPEAVIGKIFDPFFSTKESTGLGLAISYGIVRDHRGRISATNRSVRGARFAVRLPIGDGGSQDSGRKG